jgi:DNA-binding IclR family transcriptional regulator
MTPNERRVLEALSESRHCLTISQLQTRTGMQAAEVRKALDSLRAGRMTSRLNTLVESWVCRGSASTWLNA